MRPDLGFVTGLGLGFALLVSSLLVSRGQWARIVGAAALAFFVTLSPLLLYVSQCVGLLDYYLYGGYDAGVSLIRDVIPTHNLGKWRSWTYVLGLAFFSAPGWPFDSQAEVVAKTGSC